MNEKAVAVGSLCADHIGSRVSLTFGADAVAGVLYDIKHTEASYGKNRDVRCYVYLTMGDGLHWSGTLPPYAVALVSVQASVEQS